MIQERHIGGVILLGYNIDTPKQIRKLTTDLQDLSKTPLFISIDQEGGVVSRLKIPIVSEDIPQKEIKNEAEAYNVAYVRGTELKQLGINMNFSPVVDDINNKNSFLYERVFRDNLTVLAQGMINGYTDAKIISVIKHFPGHGNDSDDPHENLSEVNIAKNNLDEYLSVFRVLLQNKNSRVVMIGHISAPNISSDPASLSKVFVNDILHEDLGFTGITITDDIQMQALTKSYGIKEATLKALLAGNDILMFTGVPEQQAEAYDTILQAVRDGSISEELINEKVERILELKSLFEL
jgi:beta-N-acetylhexosaminidase